MKKVVLVANGVLASEAEPLLRTAVTESDLLFGVDGGNNHLLRLGLWPDVVSGDFDSLTESDRAILAAKGARIVPTPDQDFNDLDKAITLARSEYGATELRVFAATNGRLDHVFNALSILVKHGRAVNVRLVDEIGETWPVNGEVQLTGADLPGRTLSLLALGRVEGVTTSGLRWPLNKEFLQPGLRDGTLNEIVSSPVSLSCTSGDLLVLLHHKLPNPTERGKRRWHEAI